ncbi:MAG: hypothetical protein WAM98_20475, partial [Terriglobales bacterium]
MATLVFVLAAGLASAQSPSVIRNTRNTMNAVSNNATAASNQALGIKQNAPSAASATHAAVKISASSSPAGAPSAHAKRRERAKRGGAVLVEQNVQPASPAA